MNSIRLAVAVHGYEPEGWAHEVPRTITAHGPVLVRVLLVENPSPVAFTSLLPVARRRYAAALADRPTPRARRAAGHGRRDTDRPAVAARGADRARAALGRGSHHRRARRAVARRRHHRRPGHPLTTAPRRARGGARARRPPRVVRRPRHAGAAGGDHPGAPSPVDRAGHIGGGPRVTPPLFPFAEYWWLYARLHRRHPGPAGPRPRRLAPRRTSRARAGGGRLERGVGEPRPGLQRRALLLRRAGRSPRDPRLGRAGIRPRRRGLADRRWSS